MVPPKAAVGIPRLFPTRRSRRLRGWVWALNCVEPNLGVPHFPPVFSSQIHVQLSMRGFACGPLWWDPPRGAWMSV